MPGKDNVKEYKGRILVIDDEPEIGWIFSKILNDRGYEVTSSQTGKDGLNKIREFMPDLVFLDLNLPDKTGIAVLKDIRKINHEVIVIMITAHETIETAVAAIKLGAYDYIAKPIANERLEIIADRSLENQRLSKQVDFFTKGTIGLTGIVGQSPPMRKLFKLIESVAGHDISVILRGESGTGKELVARAIHGLSKRNNKSFVPLDCATLPDTLVESELFGYEKGAFTGANVFKAGKFEIASGGTIFLDEIGNITHNIQVKLLRVLQERTIERLGGKKQMKVDVRIIAATNKDLEEAIKKGEFREDLYHRLNVFEIMLPPLRERKDDIGPLARYFLDKFNEQMHKNVEGFSDEVLEIFKKCSWPGNVRELENTVKSSLILAEDKILPDHLPFHISRSIEKENGKKDLSLMNISNPDGNHEDLSFKEAKKNMTRDLEKYFIEKTLEQTDWNKKKAAEILDIDYKGLFTKIKKYGIKRPSRE